jgi:L-asparagine oxygenase
VADKNKSRGDMRLSLNARLTADLYATSDPFNAPNGLSDTAKALAVAFAPDRTTEFHLEQLRTSAIPWVVLQGLFDPSSIHADTPSTMRSGMATVGHEAIMAVLIAIGAARLEPISYAHENEGDIAVHLTPMRDDDLDRLSLAKSKGALRGHTDASFNPSADDFAAGDTEFSPAPDFVVLGAVRNPRNVPTRIARLSDVVDGLSASEVGELARPVFIVSPQSSFEVPGFPKRVAPVLWYDSQRVLCCRFSHSQIAVDDGLHPDAAGALRKFKTRLQSCYQDVVLSPGEIMIFNNRTLVHGRGDIGESWCAEGRWLVRAYARLHNTKHNVFDPERPWIAK